MCCKIAFKISYLCAVTKFIFVSIFKGLSFNAFRKCTQQLVSDFFLLFIYIMLGKLFNVQKHAFIVFFYYMEELYVEGS